LNKNILTVGGYDPTGGAGIIADIKTIKLLKCNPLSITTSIIPQNNNKVYSFYDLPKEQIEQQFKSIFDDFNIDIVKTGILNNDTIELLLKYYKKYNFKIICDPVLKSSTNFDFINNELLDSYFKLFNKCYIITPNNEEYNFLKNYSKFKEFENKEVYTLITGINDKLLFKGKEITTFKGKEIKNKNVHGTGCVFSSAISAFLNNDYDLNMAIKKAKEVVLGSVIYATKTKYGYNTNPVNIDYNSVIKNLNYSLYLLNKQQNEFKYFIPEVGSNIAESILLPNNFKEVASLTGRIIRNKLGNIYIVGNIEFGASEHIAKIILAANKFNPKIRSCININYIGDEFIKLLEKNNNLTIGSFRRQDEPENVSSMEWGTTHCCEKLGFVPDIIYDKGDVGKEPMIRVLGENSIDVVNKVKIIMDIYMDGYLE